MKSTLVPIAALVMGVRLMRGAVPWSALLPWHRMARRAELSMPFLVLIGAQIIAVAAVLELHIYSTSTLSPTAAISAVGERTAPRVLSKPRTKRRSSSCRLMALPINMPPS